MPQTMIADVSKMKFSEDDRILFESAQNNAQLGNIQTAIKQLKGLIIKYPKNGLLHAVLANNYWDLGDLDNAESEFSKGVGLYAKNEHCSLGYFHFLWEQDKQLEALDEMKRFLTISKSSEYDEILKCITSKLDKEDEKTR